MESDWKMSPTDIMESMDEIQFELAKRNQPLITGISVIVTIRKRNKISDSWIIIVWFCYLF